uniref:Major facilitator superfamily (MFS) profile domain-containing protein n=1 Tax=Haplochromis burtoni TaxID=8153 RepID=A0A3Q2W4I1_HAPBU
KLTREHSQQHECDNHKPMPRSLIWCPKGRLTVVLVLATLIAAFGSSFQYGYNVSVVNSPSQFMQQFYNTTYMERYHSPMEENVLTLLWSLSVSMFPLGGFFGLMKNLCGEPWSAVPCGPSSSPPSFTFRT